MEINLDFRQVFGEDFYQRCKFLLEDPNIAISELRNVDWRVRCAAIEVLSEYHVIERTVMISLLEDCLADTSDHVRTYALGLIGDLLAGENDKRLIQILLQIAADGNRSNAERRTSYYAAITILLCPVSQITSTEELLKRDRLLVERFAHSQEDSIPDISSFWTL